MDALKSWKTTAAGIVMLAITAAFLFGRVSLNELLGAYGLITGGALVAAKDAGK